ncbi:MAG: hypothetical protein JWL97_2961 [Gemmatimonadales bacterium]|nr:hypothetical protein [Gemmatimonadales bacterium]
MSMAIIEDYDPDDVVEEARPVPVWSRLFVALKHRAYLKFRQTRRRVLVRIRRIFQIDEDLIRDQIADGLRRDLESTTVSLAQALHGLNMLNARLEYHESNIPRMRSLRAEFDEGKRAEIKARDEKTDAAVREMEERQQSLADGIIDASVRPLEVVR